ncbi:MAG: hypothetical protein EAZ97_12700 [Bacteroidetes bacterium]|nr:MAG: hypothetical protein EAZ97_12700 [Bacteroidota bacterium]
MKLLKSTLLMFALLATVLVGCKKSSDPELTLAQKISKKWKVSSAKINGTASNMFANTTVTFQSDATGAATGYTVSLGGATASFSFTTGGSGSWEINSTATAITFDKGTNQQNVVNVIGTLSETGFTIEWKMPKAVDKTEPTYTLVLVPSI